MTHLELLVLNYLLNALWQVPVIFLVATLAARLARSAGPHVEHRIWVAALVLQVVLPACAFGPALRGIFLSLISRRSGHVTTQITILNATAADNGLHLATMVASAALIVYIAVLLYLAARLLYRLHHARSLRRTARFITLSGEPLTIWQRCTSIFGVHDAQLATSTAIAGPSTIGIRRRIVLLPPALLTSIPHEDLTAALAHEFAHMRRRDFARNLLYELIALPVAWHPLLWLTRHRITESREMVCDELAAQATHGTTRYAHSLLRLAACFSCPTPATTLHAIGILDANILERRVMKLTRNHLITASSRRTATAAAVLLGIATCASAMSMRLEVPAQAIIPIHTAAPVHAIGRFGTPQPQDPTRVSGGVMAGQIISKVNPVYPPEAKEKGIQGAVVLHAIIGKDGTVQNLNVVSGPDELQSSAMDAVKQWVYKPFLLNGNPTEVETTITVNYSLDNSNSQHPPSPPPPPADNISEGAHQAGGSAGDVYKVGGSVRPPIVTYSAVPGYPEEARKSKLSGNVIVGLIVDQDGNPREVHVARGLGNQLDEKAVEAVQQYRFKPATRNGEPVAVALNVEVNFRVF